MRYCVESSEIIFREFFKIERARLMWEQFDGTMGEMRTRYVIRRGDSVGVIPVCEDTDKIILVKQFRYPASRKGSDGYLWEIPAGMVDREEDPSKTAERELFEEIGVNIDRATHLISFFLSPGVLDEKFHLFYACIGDSSHVKTVGGNKHEHENLLIRMFSRKKIFEMIEENEIIDGKTIASLLFYFSKNMYDL